METIDQELTQAKACAKAGQYDEALGFVNDVLLHDPGNVDALFVRGGIYFKLGRPALAADAWTRVLSIQPGHEKASRWLGRIGQAR